MKPSTQSHIRRLTWQPTPDVRIAAVTVYFSDSDQSIATTSSSSVKLRSGFVLVGRSLREVEARERQLGFIMGVGWILFLVATLISVAYQLVRERIRSTEEYLSKR